MVDASDQGLPAKGVWSNVYLTTGRTTGMATDAAADGSTMLSPEEAFTVLGNEVRLEVLQTLGKADEPLAYSDLFEQMDYNDPGNFSYHLDQLVDHFVDKTDEGYVLHRTGERVVEAILSGAVTTDPVREPSPTDKSCPFCSAPMEIGYRQERVTMYCSECPGLYGHTDSEESHPAESGTLGIIPLPPAGVKGRTAAEMHQVAEIWTATTMQRIARGVCPRCSGTVERAVQVCEFHDASDGLCDRCGLRLAATASAVCTDCIFEMEAPVAGHLSVHPETMAFMIDHGIDPVAPEGFLPFAAVDEEVRSRQPFKAQYKFTADGERLTLTINGDLVVSDVTRGPVPEAE